MLIVVLCKASPVVVGVHSGDATLLLPAQRLFVETHRRVKRRSVKRKESLNIWQKGDMMIKGSQDILRDAESRETIIVHVYVYVYIYIYACIMCRYTLLICSAGFTRCPVIHWWYILSKQWSYWPCWKPFREVTNSDPGWSTGGIYWRYLTPNGKVHQNWPTPSKPGTQHIPMTWAGFFQAAVKSPWFA